MKTLVLDTNVFLDNPDFLSTLRDAHVVIPFVVVQELENLKVKHDSAGKNARQSLNRIESLRSEQSSLLKGVNVHDQGISVRIQGATDSVPKDASNDLWIIKTASAVGATLVTSDVAMRILADAHGVPSTRPNNLVGDLEIRDRCEIDLTQDEKDELFRKGSISISDDCFPNEFLIANQALGRYEEGHFRLLKTSLDAFGVKSRSKEQIYAMNVLMDPRIPLVTMTGAAGCGKTLLAMASALQCVIENGDYEKVMVTRPIIPMGNDIGFLPGSLEEKMDPWIQPLKDNLLFLSRGNSQMMASYLDRYIEIEALTFIRGRSLPKRFFIIDEAQNLSPAEVKTIVTRMGEGSKVVFTGDLHQIDVNRSERSSNGLSYLITKMQDQALSAHIHLTKGERSPLATLAADIL